MLKSIGAMTMNKKLKNKSIKRFITLLLKLNIPKYLISLKSILFSKREIKLLLSLLNAIVSSKIKYSKNVRMSINVMHLANQHALNNCRNIDTRVINRALEFKYISWPEKIFSYVHERDVLDVGCGTGLHALGYVVVGVSSYTGIDPKINFSSDIGKNLNNRAWEPFGWTPNDIMRMTPHIRFIRGTFEEMPPGDTFDVVVLHNATEHMHNLKEVFESIADILRPQGKIIYNHHNFFCWNGHHKMPKLISDIDYGDINQLKYLDWNHVAFAESRQDELSKKLNKIRINELKSITNDKFVIETWKEIPSKNKQGFNRFSEEILRKYPKYDKEEFTTQNIFCVARLK
jgi:SAM-dependent methyltransferase